MLADLRQERKRIEEAVIVLERLAMGCTNGAGGWAPYFQVPINESYRYLGSGELSPSRRRP